MAKALLTELGQALGMKGKVSFPWQAEMPSNGVFQVQNIVAFYCFTRIMRQHKASSEELYLHGFPYKLTCLNSEAALWVAAACALPSG